MKNKLSNAIWGLLLVVIGVGFAGNVLFDWNFELLFRGWWTLFIIIPFFISMVQNGFKTGSTIGFIIGVLLLISYYVEFSFDIWKLIVPAILIFIGIRIMLRDTFHKTPHFYEQSTNTDGTQGQTFTGSARADYSAIFAGNRIRVTDRFVGANLNAVFGGLVLDLREATIPCDIEISAQAIFGGIDIYVPAGVKVKINNVPVFGGVSNKTGQYNDAAAPTIYLNSTCMFGGIDIK